ncbi:hypothetical protein K443DRAFT_597592 [Laccaria amethystina LaAM-08-1]|uniref:Uncharacterized protein n=1 Tax=Laccaria amethystina LaAM-08-1 TaxID=1095629 RepID=A0A0C9XGH7_9AGAR|nr:hypothetical protein K443DRAFT_597592 [Laccaria amethystina LaAM-08-1]
MLNCAERMGHMIRDRVGVGGLSGLWHHSETVLEHAPFLYGFVLSTRSGGPRQQGRKPFLTKSAGAVAQLADISNLMSHPITTFDNNQNAALARWLEAASGKDDCEGDITGIPLPRITQARPTPVSLSPLTATTLMFILTVYGDSRPNNGVNILCLHVLYTLKYRGASGEEALGFALLPIQPWSSYKFSSLHSSLPRRAHVLRGYVKAIIPQLLIASHAVSAECSDPFAPRSTTSTTPLYPPPSSESSWHCDHPPRYPG